MNTLHAGKIETFYKKKFLYGTDKAGFFPSNLIMQELDIYFFFLQDRVIVNFSLLTRSSGMYISCRHHDQVRLLVYVHAWRLRVFAAKCFNRIKYRYIKGIAINNKTDKTDIYCYRDLIPALKCDALITPIHVFINIRH